MLCFLWMRTTISIDVPLLKKIREIGHRERKTFTQVVRELLAFAVGLRDKRPAAPSPFRRWHSKNMDALIDYNDKETLYKTLNSPYERGH